MVLGPQDGSVSASEDAERFYAVHRERPFFEGLTCVYGLGASYSRRPP